MVKPFELFRTGETGIQMLDMPVLRPQTANRQRRLARRRQALDIGAGLSVSLLPATDQLVWSEVGAPVEIAFSVAGERGYLRTVTPLVQRLLARADVHIRPDQLDAELAAMIVETVLAERIEGLEAQLGGEINLLTFDRAMTRKGYAALAFEVGTDPEAIRFPGVLFGSAMLLSILGKLWEKQPLVEGHWPELTFTMASRVAFTDLAWPALKTLAVGDAMLFDRVAVPGGAAIVVAEAMHATAAFDETGSLVLSEVFLAPERFALGDFLMADGDDTERPMQAIEDVALDDLPVRLVFEVGRTEVTLDQLRSLSVGAPLPLDRAASSAVHIFANGRRIGAGEMVMIGDQLGVRVTQLNSHA